MSDTTRRVADSATIHPNVILGEGVVIEEFCVIGCPPRGVASGDLRTMIGEGSVVRSHTVIYAGNEIGKNFQTGNKANVRELNTIGDDVGLGTLSVIEHHVKIAAGVRIHTQVFIPEYSRLDEGAWLGPNVVLTNAKYPQSPGVKDALEGPHIKRGAIVGANATLLPGVVVGERAIIGAGSVLTKDADPDSVWAGNPARRIKSREDLPYSAFRGSS